MKILFIVNRAEFLLSHRYEICLAALNRGDEVHVVSPLNHSVVTKFVADGITHHPVDFYTDSLMPDKLVLSTWRIIRVIRSLQPDLVHSIAMKPVVCGGIATRVCRIRRVVSSIAGLGLVFSSDRLKYRLVKRALVPILSFCFRRDNHVLILQNDNDKSVLVNGGVVDESKVHMIRGSGVDLDVFKFIPEPTEIPVILFASRLIEDKGLGDLVEAVKILKAQGIKARLLVAGVPDLMSPNSIPEAILESWSNDELIERLGFQPNMSRLLSQCNIFCFPSFYGEGVPKVLLEAAACGRPIVTTDHPGCRDAINNDTGLLVPIKSPTALAQALRMLIEDGSLRRRMGAMARGLAEKNYGVQEVVKKHTEIYQSLR